MTDSALTLPTHDLTLPAPLPAHRSPVRAYLQNNMVSPKGRYTQGRVILTMARWLNLDPDVINWGGMDAAHVAELCAHATRLYKPATARKFRAALLGIARQAFLLRQMDADSYARIQLVPPIKGKSKRKTRYLSQGELNALMDVCISDDSPAGARDGAMIALNYVAVVRREGIINIDYEHYQEVDHNGARVAQLMVHYKGGDDDTVYLSAEAKAVLDDWLAIRGPRPGPLFLRISQTGHVDYSGDPEADRLSDQAVYVIIKKRAEQAGVPDVSPNVIRHAGISTMLKYSDTATVARIAHHADPKTTMGYDSRGESEKIDGSAELHIKWKKRT